MKSFQWLQDGKQSLTVADAVDYKGCPANRSKTGGWVPAALILGLHFVSSPPNAFLLLEVFLATETRTSFKNVNRRLS